MLNNGIMLKIDNILLGKLYFIDNKYIFVGNLLGFQQAKKQFPIIPFDLNESGEKEYSKLPYPFTKFLNQTNREDIKKKLNIEDTDTDFERLIKYAKAPIEHETFWIDV